jgi:hypothetical protein
VPTKVNATSGKRKKFVAAGNLNRRATPLRRACAFPEADDLPLPALMTSVEPPTRSRKAAGIARPTM